MEDAELLLAGVLTTGDTPVVGVEGTTGAGRPDDRTETHGVRDRTDTVVLTNTSDGVEHGFETQRTNVTVGRTHRRRGNTEDGLDGLTGPAELGNDLLVGHRGKRLRQGELLSVVFKRR